MYFIPCHQVASILSDFEKKWFVAGGWAIDLFLDEETRSHSDIEIAIYRKDQFSLKSYLEDWHIKKVVDGAIYEWKNEYLERPIHELHASHKYTDYKMEILLNDSYKSDWIFRRDSRISLPEASIHNISKDDIPYFKPEIILLYKAKLSKNKDDLDFHNVIEHLDNENKIWLKNALEVHQPGHEWLKYI